MKTRRKSIVLLYAIVLALLFAGCYADIQNTEQADPGISSSEAGYENTGSEKGSPLQSNGLWYAENLQGALRDISVYPTEAGFYFLAGPLVNYYDEANQTAIVLCNRAGCVHNSSDCPAYFPTAQQLLVSDEIVYVFCESDNELSLTAFNPKSGETSTAFAWPGSEEGSRVLNQSLYAGSRIYFKVTKQSELSETQEIWVYDLEQKTTEPLLLCDDLEYAQLEAAYGDHVLVSWSVFQTAPPSMEAYFQAHPDASEDDYSAELFAFAQANLKTELREYDGAKKSFTNAAPLLQGESDVFPNIAFSSSGCGYGEYVLYTLGNKIMRYSLDAGRRELLAECDNALNGFLLDGRLLYLLQVPDGIQICLKDLENGNTCVLENDGNSEGMVFSVHCQTKNGFVGLYMGRDAWISKEDFLAENYDRAVFWR